MNNVSSLKANKTESPKTPGGISKSFLTPCRRVGLSRNWKRKGLSPFISPLSSAEEVNEEKNENRKRKKRNIDEELEQSPKTPEVSQEVDIKDVDIDVDLNRTPSRNVELPRRKKSKTLLSALSKHHDNTLSTSQVSNCTENNINESKVSSPKHLEEVQTVCTPVSHKSKKSPSHKLSKGSKTQETKIVTSKDSETKQKSPKELTKECIVVIQKKIFKQKSSDLEKLNSVTENCDNVNKNEQKEEKSGSQVLFDSDSDDIPLGKLNKSEKVISTEQVINLDEDDDFTSTIKPKIQKLTKDNIKCKETEIKTAVKKSKDVKHKIDKSKKTNINIETSKPLQTSLDDDEDFEFEDKRTILIRKSYDKGAKLLKAKSTGSITQKDIDDLQARIESKKKLLIAKSMTEDTKELRELVKKWQSGCQNALMELLELMGSKFSDKQNMDYSEMLQALKIPASLVGYDPDNDCFITPDDTNIIMSGLNL